MTGFAGVTGVTGVTALDAAFAALGLLACGAGLAAVLTDRVVHAALWLVVAVVAVAGCVLVLGAELVGLVYVLVYVGAVVVLLLFALMLTRAPLGPDRVHAVGWRRTAAAGLAGLATTALLLAVLVPTHGSGPALTPVAPDTAALATDLFGLWAWPFELLSVLLLTALVAALALSRVGAGRNGGAS